MKKKVSSKTKKNLVFLVPMTLFSLGVFFVNIFYYGYKIYSLKQEEINLKHDLSNLQEEEENLKINIEKLKDPDYLAKYARENYHYSKEDELVIQREKEEKKEVKEEEVESDYTGIFIPCIIGLFLLILYIFRRKKDK